MAQTFAMTLLYDKKLFYNIYRQNSRQYFVISYIIAHQALYRLKF